MERDFLAAIGQQQQHDKQLAREESVYFGGGRGGGAAPAMDWSFGSKPGGAAPALMSFRSPARDEPTFPHFSGFDGAARTPAPSRTLTRQRSFVADSHGSPQYAMHRPQPPPQQHALNGARAVPVSSPFNSHNNPMFFRVQSSPNLPNGVAGGGTSFKQPPFAVNSTVAGSTVGVYGTRDVQKPKKTAQLTIFYAGSVNVFDNVSSEKAQELMFLASRGSSLPSSTPVARRPEAPVFAATKITVPDEVSPAKHDMVVFQKPQHVSPPSSSTSRPITGVSRPAASLPRSASSSNIDSTVPKSSSPLAAVPPVISQAPLGLPPVISQMAPSTRPATLAVTTAAAIMPRAVPQARKASIARFLEKRKERVTATAAPYSSTKTETTSDTFGSTSAANDKSSCTDIAPSSNRDEPLRFGPQPARNGSFFGRSQASPSTKLQM